MKKIFYVIVMVGVVIGCTNDDIDFDDFSYQTVYFPFQTPLRSLMLGDEVIGDNSIDLERAFSIGATMGGVYSNDKNRELSIELAPDLVTNLTDADGNVLEMLPASYYEATFDKLTIPAGSFVGKVRVNLTDAFFQDPLTTGLHYVIPVRITAAQDSILQGDALGSVIDPDPRIAADWNILPKDYVLFGIKYVNPTHGAYLYRGSRTNLSDNSVVNYSERFINENAVVQLSTNSLTESFMAAVGNNNEGSDAKYSMKLTFDEANQTVVVSPKEDGVTIPVTGTGVYYSKDDAESEAYNDKKHRTIYLDYTYEDAGVNYQVKDSLVFIDTDVTFEDFAVNVIEVVE